MKLIWIQVYVGSATFKIASEANFKMFYYYLGVIRGRRGRSDGFPEGFTRMKAA